MRKVAVFTILVLLVGGVGKLWHSMKDGFSIRRIGAALPAVGRGEPSTSFTEELTGPFTYLGRGRQCYAFESPGRKLVLKIPRFDRYELPFIWKLPISFLAGKRKRIAEDRLKRQAFLLESFQLAARDLKDETAILYLHLQDTGCLLGRTDLIDKLGRRYEIDLNRTLFVLQEKKALMMPQFLAALQNEDRETVDRILDGFLAILKKRARFGIFNKDPSFMKNFAWEEGKGVQIDIGSFYRKEEMGEEDAYRASLKESSGPIREWLGSLDGDLLSRFDKKMEEICRESF